MVKFAPSIQMTPDTLPFTRQGQIDQILRHLTEKCYVTRCEAYTKIKVLGYCVDERRLED